jgi:hypothetical protein
VLRVGSPTAILPGQSQTVWRFLERNTAQLRNAELASCRAGAGDPRFRRSFRQGQPARAPGRRLSALPVRDRSWPQSSVLSWHGSGTVRGGLCRERGTASDLLDPAKGCGFISYSHTIYELTVIPVTSNLAIQCSFSTKATPFTIHRTRYSVALANKATP